MKRSNGKMPKPSYGRTAADHHNPASKRERILAAGLKLFAYQAYQAVTMDRVAEAAGVAKGTLYLYFPSKEALYLGILSEGMESVTRAYQSSVDANADLRERLRRAISVSIQYHDKNRDLLRLIATEEPRMAQARNRLLEAWRERGFNFFTSLVAQGAEAGVFSPLDSRLVTMAILGSIRSVLLYYGPDRPVAELSDELAHFFVNALATVPFATHQAKAVQTA